MEKHILVVDDDPDIVDVIQLILEDAGYYVQTSLNSACFQQMEGNPPDLILLDILLRRENGQELCQQLKEREQTKHIPVILLSAHVTGRSAIETCGADDFLGKPFLIEDLLDMVERRITPIRNG